MFSIAAMATAMLHREYYAAKSWICSSNPNRLQTQRTKLCLFQTPKQGYNHTSSPSSVCSDLKMVMLESVRDGGQPLI